MAFRHPRFKQPTRRVAYAAPMKWLVIAVWIMLALEVADCRAASDGMHRCIGSSGEPVFTDRPCANPALAITGGSESQDKRATGGSCPASIEELRARAASAFSRRDAIALSGLFLWRGYGNGSAYGILKDLAALVRQPLLALNIEDAPDTWPTPGYARRYDDRAPRQSSSLQLAVIVGDAEAIARTAERHFPLVHQSGCWWLLPD